MVAALLVILLAAFGPFTQQAIRSIVCRVQVVASNDVSIPVAHYINSVDAYFSSMVYYWTFNVGNSMKSAMLDALTAKDDGTNKLDFSCPTGDCTFKIDPAGRAYSSIGLCKECVDITSLVREWPGQNETTVQHDGLNLTIKGLRSAQNSISTGSTGCLSSITSEDPISWTSSSQDFGSQNITYLAYTWAPCTIDETDPSSGSDKTGGSNYNWTCPTSKYPNIPHINEEQAVLAVNCTFYPCIRSYNAHIRTGVLRETPVSQIRMKVNGSYFRDPGALLEPCFIDGQPYDRSNISRVPNMKSRNFTTVWTPQGNVQAPAECVYRMSFIISEGLTGYFRSYLFGNNQCSWDLQMQGKNRSWATCPGEAWWLDSLFNRGFATFESVDSLLQNMSLAVSNQMRAHGTNADWTAPELVSGTMWNSTVCTQVEWAWMGFPFALELMALVLLVTVIVMSLRDHGRQPIWKSSTLPLVFHGIRDDKEALDSSGAVASNADSTIARPIDLAGMERVSKGLPVRLSTKLGSSGFTVDHTSVLVRKSSKTEAIDST